MPSANDPVTELSGIGPATAETLEEQNIRTVGDLADEYQRVGSYNLPNQRVVSAARDASLELSSGSFDDPDTGLTITEENRGAAEMLGFRPIGDFDSIDTKSAKENVSEVKDRDTPLGALVEPAREGRLGGAPQEVVGWAADAAANLTDDDLGSGGIQDLNRVRGFNAAETTSPSSVELGSDLRDVTDRKFELDPLETARAMSIHQDRSAKAQRIDERRDAPKTDEITKWSSDPSHYDYVGVDTRQGFGTFFADERKRKAGGFGSYSRENRDVETLAEGLDFIGKTRTEVQERAVGESLEFDPAPFFEDTDVDMFESADDAVSEMEENAGGFF